jgi:hypothetical protein
MIKTKAILFLLCASTLSLSAHAWVLDDEYAVGNVKAIRINVPQNSNTNDFVSIQQIDAKVEITKQTAGLRTHRSVFANLLFSRDNGLWQNAQPGYQIYTKDRGIYVISIVDGECYQDSEKLKGPVGAVKIGSLDEKNFLQLDSGLTLGEYRRYHSYLYDYKNVLEKAVEGWIFQQGTQDDYFNEVSIHGLVTKNLEAQGPHACDFDHIQYFASGHELVKVNLPEKISESLK